MTARLVAFNKGLRIVVVPALKQHGFVFDRSRTFRRINKDGKVVEIINFQLGQRSTESEFTVNLAVYVEGSIEGISAKKVYEYQCDLNLRCRLSSLIKNRFSFLAGNPLLRKWFPATQDKWWKFNENEQYTQKQQIKVLDTIVSLGFYWLESNALIQVSHKAIDDAVNNKKR